MRQAQHFLEHETIDLIVCTIVFDESRMFNLLRLVKSHRKWKRIPFACCKVRPKLLDYPIALEGVQIACKAMGAAAFLDVENYDDDAEERLREDIERLLPGKDRERVHVAP